MIAELSDDIALLACMAAGSPLLEKAKAHIPSQRQNIQPLENVGSIMDISDNIQPLLSKTALWSEYAIAEDGSELLTVYLRKMYKNGKPYKNPTSLISVSYRPIMYQSVYDENTGEIREEATGKRTLPYLVDSTNYGKIETAGASFMEKLNDIVTSLSEQA